MKPVYLKIAVGNVKKSYRDLFYDIDIFSLSVLCV